jgi:salicylate biosynthesis isochorismate synthase/menaquinone-specific isochorismate synthase
MMTRPPEWLLAARERLARRVEPALRRSRLAGRPVLAAAAVAADADPDPTALVRASARPGEPWMCLEQPARQRTALAALGSVARLQASGPDRFQTMARAWRRLADDAVADPPEGPPGAGLIATGGFAFDPAGASSPLWEPFGAASFDVPELALLRRARADGSTELRVTLSTRVEPDDTSEQVLSRVDRRLAALRLAPLPLLDPDPTGRAQVSAPMAPEHYEDAVGRGVELIRRGEIEKIVLAREVDVRAPQPYDPGALLGVLREAFEGCFVFGVGRGQRTLIAASPELLIRREGLRATTLALAGSIRRSADPAVDDHLGEQLRGSAKDLSEHAIVARRIAATLSRRAVWVAAAPEPTVVRMANIQHLATPVRAQLTESVDALELAGALHPTPAVGGEPWERAAPLIRALEGIDRGWYAGPVGWIDSAGDGEFCVALRCAVLHGAHARCYAGVGVVADSDPAAELAETELKLGALLPLLTS